MTWPSMRKQRLYILGENSEPVVCHDLTMWARWMGCADRCLRRTEVHTPGGPVVVVSTVFLGIDHALFGSRPLIWETLVSGGPHDQEMRRYSSRTEAEEGHGLTVAGLRLPVEEGA